MFARDADLLLEKDSVQLSWWGEKRVFQGDFTGGDLDACVDGRSCAACGQNLKKS